MTAELVPTGTLRQIALKDIKIGERFRKDFNDQEAFIESVREKGILQPITVDKNFMLLAGERRFRAAQAIGLDKIPALVRVVEDEVDAREIELIENIFRKDFTWQEQANLIAEIDSLYRSKNQDWTVRKTAKILEQSKSNIWRSLELARAMEHMPEIAEQETPNDAFKLLKAAEERVIVGELVRRQQAELASIVEQETLEQEQGGPNLGQRKSKYSPDMAARLRIADANYRIEDIFVALKDMPSNSLIHLIECDPPYGIDLPNIREGDKNSQGVEIQTYQEIPKKDYPWFLSRIAKELYRVAGRDCWMIFWYASIQHTPVRQALVESGWKIDEVPALWVKPSGQTMQPEVLLSRQYEPFFVCYKGKPYINKRGRSNVFQFPLVPASQKYHPTERPLELIEELLDTFGTVGQVVFVPFLGSGATLRACYRTNRKGYGYDINGEYKDRFMLAVEQDAKLLIGKETPT
jgi:ParB family chromosome partitioning protein